MVRLNPAPGARHSRVSTARNNGYILLFTLGVLAVISVLILSMALSLRMDAQLVGREKLRLQDEYTLFGAVQYTVARLNATLESQRQLGGKPFDANTRGKLWFTNEGPYAMKIFGTELVVSLEDAGIFPDANLLTEQEWQRLFTEMGENDPLTAATLAGVTTRSKLSLAKNLSSGGFTSFRELLSISGLPQHLTRGLVSSGLPGFLDLLVIGTDLKQLEINRSSPILFKVLAGFNDNQVSNLQLARSRGTVTPIEGQNLLFGSPAKLMTEKTDLLRIKIQMKNDTLPAHTMQAVAILKLENSTYKILNQFVAEQF